MYKLLLSSLLTLIFTSANAQKEDDSKIIIHVTDSTNLYKRVKFSLINMDFIVKDLENRDTLKTYAREFLTEDYLIATAIIKDKDVTLSGIWGSRKLNIWGYSITSRDYKQVYYYKSSVEWKILRLVAEGIGGELKFTK